MVRNYFSKEGGWRKKGGFQRGDSQRKHRGKGPQGTPNAWVMISNTVLQLRGSRLLGHMLISGLEQKCANEPGISYHARK